MTLPEFLLELDQRLQIGYGPHFETLQMSMAELGIVLTEIALIAAEHREELQQQHLQQPQVRASARN